MLESIRTKYEQIDEILERLSATNANAELLRLSVQKSDIKDITKLTKLFDDAITTMECEKYPRMHFVLPEIEKLIKKDLAPLDRQINETAIVRCLKKWLRQGVIEKCQKKLTEHHYASSIFNPSDRNKLFFVKNNRNPYNNITKTAAKQKRQEAINLIQEKMNQIEDKIANLQSQ